MTPKQLSGVLQNCLALGRERPWLEYKTSLFDPQAIGKTVSALANSALLNGQRSGYLIWGVNNKLEVVGTDFRFEEAKYKNQAYENYLHTMIRPHSNIAFYGWHHNGHYVEMLVVPEAPGQPVTFDGAAYFRINQHRHNLKDFPNVAEKIWTAKTPSRFEHTFAADGLNAYDVISLLDYEAFYRLSQRNAGFAAPESIVKDLVELDVVTRDESGKLAIPNYSAIALARRLDQFSHLKGKVVRLFLYKGRNKVEAERPEIRGVRGYAVGFGGLISYMMDNLPASESIDATLRAESTLYPEVALRELIANALIHQDFTQEGTHPMIEVYSDRVEITNNGLPLINPRRFVVDAPQSRNEQLAELMRKMRLFEGRGSGVLRVLMQAEEHGLPPPDFLQQPKHMRTILFAPRPISELSKKERIRACFQHACIKFMGNDYLTNTSLRSRLGLADSQTALAGRVIADTLAAELIIADVERGPQSRYEPYWAPEMKGLS